MVELGIVERNLENMPNSDLPQGMYSPLSQNMTDSDSEEEIHSSSTGTQIFNHQNRKMSSLLNSSHILISGLGGGGSSSGSMHEINCNNYSNLRNVDTLHGSNMMMDSDNVAILCNQNAPKVRKPMGPIRKLCFILSLFACVLTVVLFLWVVPCSDHHTCPAKSEKMKTHNWMRNYEKIELKGAINVVDGIHGRSRNLVFMYRGDKLWSSDDVVPSVQRKRNGIISLIGNSGQVGWYDEIANEPNIIDCTLIDADRNGSPDCLIVDEFGEIGCINPISGQWLWHIADRTTKNPELLNFPLILPDLNADGVYELLVASSIGQGLYNNLIIVSGRNGESIGSQYSMKECSYIHKFQLDKMLNVSFNCISNDTEVRKTKPLAELYRLITNKSVDLRLLSQRMPTINQHKFYGQRKETINQRNIYSVSGKQLIVENIGKCPENCNVTVQLIEQKNGKDHIMRTFNGSSMYGMVPAILSFNTTSVNSKSLIHGFVIKFWEWSKNESDHLNARHKREFNRFKKVIREKNTWRMPNVDEIPLKRYKRNTDPLLPYTLQQNISSKEAIFKSKMRMIKETVVLIVFNSTDIRIENTSQSNIIQFCRREDENSEMLMCQPDLNYQENSLLIADLDQDGSQELVSYYSTFVNSGGSTAADESWKLLTYVQLLKLEAELPKLYSDDKI